MYRIQRYDDTTTGIHWQIGKGGGFHYYEAEQKNRIAARDDFFIGGAPAMILVGDRAFARRRSRTVLASVLADGKIETVENPLKIGHRLIAEAEFAICGKVRAV